MRESSVRYFLLIALIIISQISLTHLEKVNSFMNSANFDSNEINFEFPTQINYSINIIFLGINESRVNQSFIEKLPIWYSPVDLNFKHDLNFTIDYKLIFLNETILISYIDFLKENFNENLAPSFIQPEHSTANYISSYLVENYISEKILINNIPSLIIIDTYSINPLAHEPYYYNASVNELDAELNGLSSNPAPFLSTYQISGGGNNNRFLWIDLSAGPTFHGGYIIENTYGVVNRSTIPPIWSYSDDSTGKEKFNNDLVKYVIFSLEYKFLSSYSYPAKTPFKEIKLEVFWINFSDSDFNITTRVNLDYIVSKYKESNPYIKWSYSLSEYHWQFDDELILLLKSKPTKTEIRNYLGVKSFKIFNVSSPDRLIIPIFLLVSPPYKESTENLSGGDGLAYGFDGEFKFIIISLNEEKTIIQLKNIDTFIFRNESIPVGGYKNIKKTLGYRNSILEISLEVKEGAIDIIFLDDNNLQKFNQTLQFSDLLKKQFTNINSSIPTSLKIPINIYDNYSLLIVDSYNSSPVIDIEYKIYEDYMFGFTWTLMHEIGHALGLAHPFQTYSWGNYDQSTFFRKNHTGFQIEWLWDMAPSIMSYSSQSSSLAQMDLDCLMRMTIPNYWSKISIKLKDIKRLENNHNVFSEIIMSQIIGTLALFNRSVEDFINLKSLENYNESLKLIFEIYGVLESVTTVIQEEILNKTLIELSGAIFLSLFLTSMIIILKLVKKKKKFQF